MLGDATASENDDFLEAVDSIQCLMSKVWPPELIISAAASWWPGVSIPIFIILFSGNRAHFCGVRC